MELEYVTNGIFDDSVYEIGGNFDVTELENERCGICMDAIIDRGVLDCCQHWFCFACIDNWATITNLCPLCQNEFQLITCVPVYDTIGSGNVEDDSLSRHDDWCIQGTNNTLSFPSYYIDENAVICLDGNGCKIRNGVATSGDDSVLDTSIACDSCDIWYHAFCVDFDPESTSESSWLCPRCMDEVPEQSAGALMAKNQYGPDTAGHEHSMDASHSGKVSVSVADTGETAVVVSMVEGKHCIKERTENCLPAQHINENNRTLDNKSTIQSFVGAEENSLALSLSQDTQFTMPCDSLCLSELETNFADEAVCEPIIAHRCELFSGLLSDKPNMEIEQSEMKSNVDLHLGLSVGSSLPADDIGSEATENDNTEVLQLDNLTKEFSVPGFLVDKIGLDADEDAVRPSCVKRKSMSSSSDLLSGDTEVNNVCTRDTEVDNVCTRDTEVDNVCTRDTEVDNFCTRDIEVDNVRTRNEMAADPLAKKAKTDGKSEQTPAKDGGRKLILGSTQECSHLPAICKDTYARDEMVAKVPTRKTKIYGKSQQVKPEVKKSISGGTQEFSRPSAGSEDDKLRDVPEKEDSTPEVLSTVRGTNQRRAGVSLSNPTHKSLMERDNGARLRVKKIMRRAPEDESSKLVENLRKEIKEAVRSKSTKDFSKTDQFDPKLLIAFRNAIVGSRPEQEPVKKLNPSMIRAKQSMLQKGKVRENLTKKIYGNSNGRRKRAWDRDWEVEFWKHRCRRATKPEKVQTLKSVLDLLRRSSESSEMEYEPGEEAANPILSRLYLADTSVFPRNDDIKPLSALTATGNSQVKVNVSKPVNDNINSRTPFQSSTNSSSRSINKQNPMSMTSGSKVNGQSLEEVPGKSEVKIDKKKWALEVLARKTSTVQRSSTQGNEEDNTALNGNFPLLAQLPPDMRPALAPSCHNKVASSVRQAQLYRLTEHLLRKADLPVIRRTAETEFAVADAINIEKDAVNRSSSKLVYMNLCAQVLSQHMTNSRPDSAAESGPSQADPQPKESVGPPPDEPLYLSAEAALRMAGLLSDSPPNSPSKNEDKGPDNVFDIDTHAELDIYGDFEYDLEAEDYIGGFIPKVSKPEPEEGDLKIKVVFSTLNTETKDDAMELKVNESHKDMEVSTLTESSCALPEPLQAEINGELSLADCEELYGTDKEPLVDRFPDKASKAASGFDSESCADNILVKSGLRVACDSSGESSLNRSLASENPRKDKKTNKAKQSDIIHSISRKVEAYIKEHIRPLCKSGVISVDQYRWAVERTTAKIMRYHSKDSNANFLIKEGEKVKKLAEQYVEAAQKKDSS